MARCATARRATLLLAAVLALAACEAGEDSTTGGTVTQAQPALAAPQGVAAAEGVTVTGHGRVTGEPDTLRATVGVQVVREGVDEAFDAAAEASDRLLAALREHGVAEGDIQTRDFSVRPEQRHHPDEPPEIVGYSVRNLVEVKIRAVGEAGELLAAVVEAAGDDARVQGLRWTLEDNEAQLRGAREHAFEDARAKAGHYADLAGLELGELVSVTEVGAHLPPPVPVPEETLDAGRAAPSVSPGEQEVGVQLQATWRLR